MTKAKYPELGSSITPEILPWCISQKQVAEILGVSGRQVERYVAEGKLPVVNLGHRTKPVYYKDLEDFVNNRREQEEPDTRQ